MAKLVLASVSWQRTWNEPREVRVIPDRNPLALTMGRLKRKLPFLVCFALFPLCCFAGKRVELAVDWLPSPPDQSIFDAQSGSGSSLFCSVKKKVLARGWQIESVDLAKYKNDLRRSKKKKWWERIKDQLGFSRPLDRKVSYLVLWGLKNACRKYDFSKLPKEKLVLFMWEPSTVEPYLYQKELHHHFSKIFTWDDDLVDNKRYFKFYYPVLLKMREDIPDFESRKLCTLVSSNLHSKHPHELYSKRKESIQFFENLGGDEFDFYGMNWEGCGYKNYRGSIKDKGAVLKNYRFAICYENLKEVKGYITEKIFDCFSCGVVPVYWGASNIEDYIPPDCFIDRRKFSSNEEVYRYLKNISREEFERYLEQIRAFLLSEKAQLFSQENFLKTFEFSIRCPHKEFLFGCLPSGLSAQRLNLLL
ncbi:MAG: hypothetical protein A3G30_06010 [Chlamydiae bacterium RIFCSPLOWO2_12_FULL_49_12]|nr:MAG: hypothetical protein A3G30_06010 [Chlamydiae bacterium RIFCSPLOWO2_12_FULL_49_12]